jgi:AcrR family transcriptional regulator
MNSEQTDPGETQLQEPPRLSARGRRRDRRSIATINRILEVTEELLLSPDHPKLSILNICQHAGVSRGTFYRYFSSQEELLDVFSRFMRDKFHTNLLDAVGPVDNPDQKFDAFVAYFDNYLHEGKSRRFLEVAPDYAVSFFNRVFSESVQRFESVLESVFDAWDQRLGVAIDRTLICEMLMRHILSEQLVPCSDRRALMLRLKLLVSQVASVTPAQRMRFASVIGR